MIVTATQIKIGGIVAFFRFIATVLSVRRQLRESGGLVFVSRHADGKTSRPCTHSGTPVPIWMP